MNKYIGGFFELETQLRGRAGPYHTTLFLNSGRACLSLIIQKVKPKKIHIPFYTCDSLLEPLQVYKVPFEFYAINEQLEPVHLPEVNDGEYFLYIDYFGLKSKAVKTLLNVYGSKLIMDNSQAFFSKNLPGIYAFNSVRKYFGVPDGAYLYSPVSIEGQFEINTKINLDHLQLRRHGKQAEAFHSFQEHEDQSNCDIYRGSSVSEEILKSVDYISIAEKRRRNFELYHQALSLHSVILFAQDGSLQGGEVPFHYPLYLPKEPARDLLYKENVFVPVLWKDVVNRGSNFFKFEKTLSSNTLLLPVDHRYGDEEISFVIDLVKKRLIG